MLAHLVLQGLVPLGHQGLDFVPLRVDVGSGQVGIRVESGSGDAELLGDGFALADQSHDGLKTRETRGEHVIEEIVTWSEEIVIK